MILTGVLCTLLSCSGKTDLPGAPGIDNITAEATSSEAIISFHISGKRESIRESGIVFGEDKLDNDTKATEVRGGEDPSRHNYIIISLQNLKPSTRYYYKVFISNGHSSISSEILTFTTKEKETPGTEPGSWLTLPNQEFLAVLLGKYDSDRDGGLGPKEVESITEIDITGMGLSDISGIELFPSLRKLLCSGNIISEIDISACPVLNYLDCNPMEDSAHQTTLKTLYIRRDQPIDFIDKPAKTVIRIKE